MISASALAAENIYVIILAYLQYFVKGICKILLILTKAVPPLGKYVNITNGNVYVYVFGKRNYQKF